MWLLKDDNNERIIYLKPNATTTVGRSRGDIVLENDKSISRHHAQITVKTISNSDQITDKTQPISTCALKDAGSKYGNFILSGNEATSITEEGYQLRHMDRIRFGLQNYIFTVHYIPIITATSGMSEDEKKRLTTIIDAIDGKCSPVWNPLCTHMTVTRPTISEKLTCALAAQTPIVPLDYWVSVLAAFRENTELPDPAGFVDSINLGMREVEEISISPNPARQTLFRNLTFLHFSTKQFTLYARMIKLAGGKSIQYSPRRAIPDVCDGSVIVVQLVESNTTQATGTGDASYAAVCEKLSQCRRRTIPDSEIALAILHCSTEKYCNPLYDYAVLFRRREADNQVRNTTVLAVDTQDVLGPSTSRPGQSGNRGTSVACIPETIAESCDTNVDTPNEYPKNSTNDLPTSPEYNSDDLSSVPSESQIGSMKMASLNHEHYVEEEFRRKFNMNNSNKRHHDEEEDGAACEREKKICLGESSSGKESKKESNDRDQSDVLIISNSEDDGSVERNKYKHGPGVPAIGANRGEQRNGSSKLDLSYEEIMPDDEDAIFLDDKLADSYEGPEKKQDKQKNLASRLSPPSEVSDVGNRKKSGKSIEIDKLRRGDALKLTTVSSASRIGKDGFRSTGKRNLLDDSAAENEKTREGKIGKSHILSDYVKNPYNKYDKPKDTSEGQSKNQLSKNTSVKRPLMSVTSASLKCRVKNESKEDWIVSNTTHSVGIKKEPGALDDTSRTSPAHDYETTDCVKKSSKDQNASTILLLRVKCPAEIYTKDRPRFGKRFRKQQVTIPPRVELDGSVYDAKYVKKEPKTEPPLDDDEEEDAITSRKLAANDRSRAKKNFFRL